MRDLTGCTVVFCMFTDKPGDGIKFTIATLLEHIRRA